MPSNENTITTVPGAPRPNGDYYSLVVRNRGDTIHVSGWMGDDPETGKIVEGGVGAQAEQAMRNIKACLEAAGSDLSKIVRRRLYFMNIKRDLQPVMAAWSQYAPELKPTSTAVQISGLAKEGALIEIEVEAEA